MKETTNVSIAGIAFRLDNEGYLQLKNYLTRIELGYKNNPDGAEILADIEARVCELILNQQSADQLVPADRIRTTSPRRTIRKPTERERPSTETPFFRTKKTGPGIPRCLAVCTATRKVQNWEGYAAGWAPISMSNRFLSGSLFSPRFR